MKRQFCYSLIIVFLFFSCRDVDKGELLVIPVDTSSDVSLPLSTITDEITAVELDFTEESLINPDGISSVHLFENHIYLPLHLQNKILVFDMDGKFVRSIGSKGQGPGEFLILLKFAIDEKNKRLIVVDYSKIICYDLNGKLLFQTSAVSLEKGKLVYDINRVNDEIFVFVDQYKRTDAKGTFSQPQIYRMNDDFQIIDSLTVRKTYYERLDTYGYIRYLILNNSNTNSYIYFPDHSWQLNKVSNATLRDTLYRFENNQLIPDLKLKFKNVRSSDDDYPTEIVGIYRSDRYVFATYLNHGFFIFCYDTKTGNGYNMKNSGFTDDIHKIDKRIEIHPFANDTELFYYWHTHMDKDDLNEPNPTLYIGRLKR